MPINLRRERKGPFWLVADMCRIESRSVLVVKRDIEPTVAFHYDSPMKLNECHGPESVPYFYWD